MIRVEYRIDGAVEHNLRLAAIPRAGELISFAGGNALAEVETVTYFNLDEGPTHDVSVDCRLITENAYQAEDFASATAGLS